MAFLPFFCFALWSQQLFVKVWACGSVVCLGDVMKTLAARLDYGALLLTFYVVATLWKTILVLQCYSLLMSFCGSFCFAARLDMKEWAIPIWVTFWASLSCSHILYRGTAIVVILSC